MPDSYLIISYAYAPQQSARAFRWQALAEYWAAQSLPVTVIAAREGDLPAHETLNGVDVRRVNHRLVEWARQRYAARPAEAAPASSSESTQRRSAVSPVVSAAYWLFRTLYWPDAAFYWIRPASLELRRVLAERRYESIISVSPFFSAHLVGARAKRWSPESRWLMDYGDPFSVQDHEPHNNAALYRGLNRRVERRLQARSDAISLTTNRQKLLYRQAFPADPDRLHVIPPLLSIGSDLPSSSPSDDGRLRLVYAGKLYADTRSPDFLLRLLDGLGDKRMELHLYGDTTQVADVLARYESLREHGLLVLHGQVDRESVMRAMAGADVLVNIGNKTAYQLPSKVIEYASTGKPILNLSQIVDDTSAEVFASYPAALNLLEGERVIEEQVTILRRWLDDLPPLVDPDLRARWLAPYQLDSVAAAYEAALSGD